MNETTVIDLAAQPRMNRLFRLQWEEAQQAHVLLYPEGMVKLNPSAAEILKRCNGTRSVQDMVAELERMFNIPGLEGDIKGFLALAMQQRWVEIS